MKFGYQGSHLGDDRTNFTSGDFVAYRFNNGVPNQITAEHQPLHDPAARADARRSTLQDAWTFGRITFQGALRYDRASSYFPEQTVRPSRFFPTAVVSRRRRASTPTTTLAARRRGDRRLWQRQDVAEVQHRQVPRGRTERGALHHQQSDTPALDHERRRTWTDNDRDYVPDCDLLNPAAQNRPNGRSIASGTEFRDARARVEPVTRR